MAERHCGQLPVKRAHALMQDDEDGLQCGEPVNRSITDGDPHGAKLTARCTKIRTELGKRDKPLA